MAGQKLTIAEIAKLSGVSAATVSRVFNHPHLVRPETVQAVTEVLNRQGFSSAGKKIGADRGLILFNYADNANPFYSPLIEGMLTSINSHDCSLLTSHYIIDEKNIADYIQLLRSTRARGLVVADYLDVQLLRQLRRAIPVVQCCEYNTEAGLPYVGIDNFTATQTAMAHILSTGHQKVALLNGPLQYQYARERRSSYLTFLQDHGLEISPHWIIDLPKISFELAYSSVKQLFSSNNQPNAFFASSDSLAAAAICAARDSGLDIPGDLVVVGFDNITISVMTSPALTTINQPTEQMGYSACELLFEYLQNPASTPRSMRLPTELIVRGSTTGPARHGWAAPSVES